MTVLRDAATSLLHRAGIRQIATRLREFSQFPERAAALILEALLTHA